jgi:2-phospho-L-lactate guanylyltransferase (CobY/MobA/RfbA family)
MAIIDQPRTTYTNTEPQIRVVTDLISLIDPMDTPFLAVFPPGGANSKFNFTAHGTKIEWLEDEFEVMADDLDGSITSTATTITLTDASAVQVGDILMIDAEYVVVASIASEVATVHARDYGGTNATHADAAVVYRVGQARLEGADAAYGPLHTITAPYNHTSIFQHARQASGTVQVIDQYGIANDLDYQADKMMPELLRLLNRAMYHSTRQVGTATAPRSMGGLEQYITDNEETTVGAIAALDFDNLADKILADGGQPTVAFLHPTILTDIKNLLGAATFLEYGPDVTRLGVRVATIRTQFGDLSLVWDRWCPAAKLYVIDERFVGVYALRPFQRYALARTGDADAVEVVGEYSLVVKHDAAHGKMSGLTT